jgi:hypothetical protein
LSIFTDIGTPGDPSTYSWPAIDATSFESHEVGSLPLLFATSNVRPLSEGYSFHATGNAEDFGNNAGDAGSPQMDLFAAFLEHTYAPYCLELIHVNQDGSTVEWKYGIKQPTGWYGWPTLDAHRNHVHWAITGSGIAAEHAAGVGQVSGDIMASMPTLNSNVRLLMTAPTVRTVQGLLEARGGMIKPSNTNRFVLMTVIKWFQGYTHLPVDGIVGQATWERLVQPVVINGRNV